MPAVMDIGHEPTDEGLVAAALSGNDEAFSILVSRHKHRVFGIASRFARNSHELDDLAQDIFIKAYKGLAGFRSDAPFGHWLSRVAVRKCYDLLRARRREIERVPLDGAFPAEEADPNSAHAREVLDSALERLKADERLVITMLELEDRSVREIAELTGWSESNVKVRAHRARQALKKILEATDEWR